MAAPFGTDAWTHFIRCTPIGGLELFKICLVDVQISWFARPLRGQSRARLAMAWSGADRKDNWGLTAPREFETGRTGDMRAWVRHLCGGGGPDRTSRCNTP
jgi:hypothetical protein